MRYRFCLPACLVGWTGANEGEKRARTTRRATNSRQYVPATIPDTAVLLATFEDDAHHREHVKRRGSSRMSDYQDIREFRRSDRYLGMTYSVTTWHEENRYFISAIDIADLPRIENAHPGGFESLREALEAGESVARSTIDAQFPK
jgi:hypothetical protein